jgi:excisionase family DNA binding protein
MDTLPLKPTFTVSEAAFEIGCSTRTVQRRIKEPEGSRYRLIAHKTGKGTNSHYKITRQDLQDFLQRTTVGNIAA